MPAPTPAPVKNAANLCRKDEPPRFAAGAGGGGGGGGVGGFEAASPERKRRAGVEAATKRSVDAAVVLLMSNCERGYWEGETWGWAPFRTCYHRVGAPSWSDHTRLDQYYNQVPIRAVWIFILMLKTVQL